MTLTLTNFPLVIEPAEFAKALEHERNNPDLRIVDLSNEANFLNAHIPGAIYLPFQSLMLGQPPAPGKLPPKSQLENVFKYLGLTENTHFIVCDDEGGGWAGRFIWTLDVIGHSKYSYINGGMNAWLAEELPIEKGDTENPFKREDIPAFEIDRTPIADVNEIMDGLTEKRFQVWDARSPQEHSGAKILAAKGGHIPGAINAEWTSLMDPQRNLKIKENAKEYLCALGIDGSIPIITHCQSHHRSGFTYLLGKHLGFNIRAYDGSWSEWGNHPDTPVEQ